MTVTHPAVLDEVNLQAVRRRGIGGSDVPAIIGVSPFRTGADVFNDKLRLGPPFVETEPMRWGKLFEPIIAAEYADREGVGIQWPTAGNPESRFLTHSVESWRRATVDYFQTGAKVGVDVKMASVFSRDKWGMAGTDQIPDDYLLQMLWYLDVTGFERWDVAVLLGSELRVYRVHPHESLQAHLRDICGRFWHEHVLAKVPPRPQNADDARRQLEALYPRDRSPVRPATSTEAEVARLYARAHAQSERAASVLDHLRRRICEAIGDAGGIEGDFGRITWKRSSPSPRVDWEQVARALSQIAPTEYQKQCRAHTKTVDGSRRFLAKFDALGCAVPEFDTLDAVGLDAAALLEEAPDGHE